MVDWIMAFVQLCHNAVAAGKFLIEWRANQLTDREIELLRTAAEEGMFQLAYSDHDGLAVLIGNKSFTDTDPAITAKYLDAFMRLCDRGLIIHQDEREFRLTGQGFDLARSLRAKAM
jgi:hypothetical protein